MRRLLAGLVAAALMGAAACSGGEEPAPSSGTDGIGADLLESRDAAGRDVPVSGDTPTPPLISRGEQSEAPAADPRERPSDPVRVDVAGLGHHLGDPDAPVRVLEFSDFACGYCRQFHLETWPHLEERYVAAGRVRWQYIPMVLGIFGPNSENAALAGECAIEQDRFPAVRERLFADQGRWKRSDRPRDVFRDIVREEGLDVGRWERCMAGGTREQRVEAGTALSRRLGVRGTPTFFIVGYGAIPGAVPRELFEQVLDTVLADAGAGSPR